ncbi:LPXTG-motif cell wall anchor domain protein [Beutenbergia cavernae DSM 12333]|uniref:alpha-amylase n=1 Tax=Beutenbergia cavernae (strain ATCC BAA-8 / DSM 12333 / CCUG 43141 / JCM 11478 / NBRC 16432 / NCIMB 13614 / HKI 0122) TaxID=471853 RepID=C5C5Z3_BEUC1|nr:LPXTG-motif cell wall anchor domain protein [Beutenbergia cavernae DSM 12333]
MLVTLLAAVLALAPSAAVAATTAGWASWQPLAGSAGAFTTTMQLPAGGFPAATVTTDSRGGQVGVQSGASIWMSAATPPGAVYGSSQNQSYLNLRPRADNATSPSTTTYTFERPTPAGGWSFVLGDIDADRAVVIARGEDGQLLTGAELGWQGGFNYCATTPSPACTGSAADVATFDPVSGEVLGNAAGLDTSGAAGWFSPTVPITSLTVFFFQRSGFPVYQTWFASLARDITGTVTHDVDGPLGGATLTLFGPDGTQLATTTSAADGTYSFPGYAAADGYTVEVTAPPAPPGHPGYFSLAPTILPADLSTTDATGIDFGIRDIVPIAVSGAVLTTDGEPVPGVTVTLTPVGGGDPFTAVTDSQGRYVVDDVPWDLVGGQPQEYEFSLGDLPPGFTEVSAPPNITVEVGQEEPSTGNDFVVQAPASVSGTVTAGGSGVPGAVVTITGPGGTFTTPTAADGTYSFGDLPPGDYTVTLEVPFGYTADGPTEQQVTVETEDVTDVDFAVQKPGAVGGTVTDDEGNPIAGATVTVSGPDGDVALTTDDAGSYFLDQLPQGEYTITLTVPDGYTGDVTELTTTITAAGESRLDQDFVVAADEPPLTVPAGGTVTDTDGNPVPGAEVTVRDSGGAVVGTVTTGDDGTWGLELPPGAGYTAEVTPPEGYEVDGEPVLTFDVAETAVAGLDFVLQAVTAPTPTPTPGDPGPGSPGPGTPPGRLPATGADADALALTAALLAAAGCALVAAGRRRGTHARAR